MYIYYLKANTNYVHILLTLVCECSYALDDHLIEEFGDNSDDQSVHCETTVIQPSQETQTNKLSTSIEEEHDHVQQNTVSVQATDFMPVQEESVVMDHNHHQHHHHSHNLSCQNTDFTRGQGNHHSAPQFCNAQYLDADEKFLLSCAPALRRFTNRQNAIARLQIQQLLFDIEFGDRQNQ